MRHSDRNAPEGARAGLLLHASKLSFPAATVTTMPLFHALVTAVSIAMSTPLPSEIVITLRLFCITAGPGTGTTVASYHTRETTNVNVQWGKSGRGPAL